LGTSAPAAARGAQATAPLESPAESLTEPPNLRPTLRSARLAAGSSPRIDGVLDDAAWQEAARIGALTQVEPFEGVPARHGTEVLVAHDADFVYVALLCADEPEAIRARQMDRDADVQYDDVVQLWFDTFDDGRFAYWFQVTPGGSLGDALISDNGSSFNKQWDGIWYGRTAITEAGWQAELAFPVQTFSFDPARSTWGFNVTRERIADGEDSRWATPRQGISFFTLSDGGHLTGLTGLHQGRGIEIIPYARVGLARPDSSRSEESAFDAGVDIAWRPTPASTLRLTINTDFAETEVDNRQINLDRFPLFFPEKRDFFLEDAGVFEFGAPTLRRSLVPFFSRTVGRGANGEAIPLLVGGKFTGRFGDWNIGALGTLVDGTERTPEQGLGVLRISRNLGDGRSVGGLVTTGDPEGGGAEGGGAEGGGAATFGIDTRLGSSRLFGPGRTGFLWAYLLGTTGDGEGGDDTAYGVEAQTRSRTWRHSAELQRVGAQFDPKLGFVGRRGFERAGLQSEYTWRTDDTTRWLRSYSASAAPTVTRDLDGDEDGYNLPVKLFGANLWTEDSVELEIERIGDQLDDGFALSDSVRVPAGEYEMTRWSLEVDTNDRRRVLANAGYEWGDYFGGEIRTLSFAPLWVPNRFVTLGLDYSDIEIEIEAGRFHTQLYGWRANFTFTPDVAWRNLVQYDTESKQLGAQSRLHWIIEPGRDLFVVLQLGFSKEDHDAAFVTGEQNFIVKLGYTWRR